MIGRVVEMYGDRPYGFTDADPDTRLENFLNTQVTPGAFEQILATRAQVDGLPLAEMLLMNECTHLNRMLINRGAGRKVLVAEIDEMDEDQRQRLIWMGADVVYQAQFEKRLGRTEQTIRRLDKLESLPKAHVYIPPPRPPLSSFLGMPAEPMGMGMGVMPPVPMPMGQMPMQPPSPAFPAAA